MVPRDFANEKRNLENVALIRASSGRWFASSERTRKILQDRAIRSVVAVAGLDEMRQGLAHLLKLSDFVVDCAQVLFSDGLYLGTFPRFILVKAQEIAAILDREPERARATQERKLVQIGLAERAVSVAAALRS